MNFFWRISFQLVFACLAFVPCQAQARAQKGGTGIEADAGLSQCQWDTKQSGIITKIISADEIELDGEQKIHLINLYIGYGKNHKKRRKLVLKELRQYVGQEAVLYLSSARIDQFQRLRAHVQVGGVWLQGAIIKKGYAQVIGFETTSHCVKPLLLFERQARDKRLGLWAQPEYMPKQASWVKQLLKQRGKFTIVFGKVVSAKQTRKHFYLNFGTNWDKDFTVLITRKIMRKQRGSARTLAKLKGQCLQLRGWIEDWRGPLIKLDSLQFIEPCMEKQL